MRYNIYIYVMGLCLKFVMLLCLASNHTQLLTTIKVASSLFILIGNILTRRPEETSKVTPFLVAFLSLPIEEESVNVKVTNHQLSSDYTC